MSCNYDWRHKQAVVRYVRESYYASMNRRWQAVSDELRERDKQLIALLERHKRLVLIAGCALPWVESVTEYHELEAALAEEVE
jgi:hypothetical protein